MKSRRSIKKHTKVIMLTIFALIIAVNLDSVSIGSGKINTISQKSNSSEPEIDYNPTNNLSSDYTTISKTVSLTGKKVQLEELVKPPLISAEEESRLEMSVEETLPPPPAIPLSNETIKGPDPKTEAIIEGISVEPIVTDGSGLYKPRIMKVSSDFENC